MTTLSVAALVLFLPLTVAAAGIEGDWNGVLNAGAVPLRLVLHFARDAGGLLSGSLDSIDQGAKGIPFTKITEAGQTLSFEIQTLGATFQGDSNAEVSQISGTFRQGGQSFPLVLHRGVLETVRPQDPVKPYPYDERDVTYDNPKAHIKLAGSLTLPRSPAPHPAVLLITGSGPQDRDEALMGHRPFLVIADYLTRRGIAVLRVDDRGTGQSTGNFKDGTTVDFAGDARASLDFLKTQKDIDPTQIGLIGHSEGGIIAPMLASESSDIAFVVLLAGPGVTGEQILIEQQYLINRAMGMPEEAAKKSNAIQRFTLHVIVTEEDPAEARRKILEGVKTMLDGLPEDQLIASLEKQIPVLTSPWFRAFLTYDPRAALTKVKVPLLAMNGALDLQVPPHQNLPAIAAALEEGHNADYQIVKLPHLNHLFQTAKTGAPTEYAKIDETFAPVALQIMGDWIIRHVSIK